jgi:hypothetical protein
MKHTSTGRFFAVLFTIFWSLSGLFGQSQASDPLCTNGGVLTIRPSAAYFNYGNSNKMKSSTRRMKLTIGQPAVGIAVGENYNMNFGYWAGYLVAPFPPMVTATQGDLLDRIQISWANNPLGPFPTGGFKIFRDGVYLASVDKNTKNYNDFNVIAGKPYKYEVKGINAYGEGSGGKALGFQVPNGVVTGWIRTLNSNAVPDAMVALTPMQGFSAYFGPQDGASAIADTSTGSNFLPMSASTAWSISFYAKTQAFTGDACMLELSQGLQTPIPLAIHPTANGILVQVAGTSLSGDFLTSPNNWHHVALTFEGNQYRLYLDGALVSLVVGSPVTQSSDLSIGTRSSCSGSWTGRLDELRIYHRRLDELDLPAVMEGTASSLTPNLKYYWKMDEEQGTKSFDILHRTKLFFCGARFDADRPPVRTAGTTDSDGYYRIESASYGTGTTFLAQPMKSFYKHRALKFVRSESDYATLPDFSLAHKATLELWVNSGGPDGTQCLLSKKWGATNNFQLQLEPAGTDNNIILKLNGGQQTFGLLGIGYHHLAVTLDSTGTATNVAFYKDGILVNTAQLPAVSGNWSDSTQVWSVGARKSGNAFVDNYGGLIDEFAVYDTTLSVTSILHHAQNSRNPQETGLKVYFSMDEGFGNRLNNSGSMLLSSTGMTHGTAWTILAPNQSTTPHVFSPGTRQVTLNPSITSVDQVDFTDRSTVAVSGFVRYKNTDCFAKKVEILVNGESYNPPVYTDTTGKFIIDLEPGATVTLTPKFEDHQFVPAFWDVTNISSPIAGIVFNDITTRKVSGQVAGGHCKKSIITNPGTAGGTVCVVKVRSLNGCFEKIIQIDNEEGHYVFNNLPPMAMTVAVVEHSDPNIKTAFQVLGGEQVDLTKRDTIVDFIYYAQPKIEIASGLDPFSPTCPTIVLDRGTKQNVGIRVKEVYPGGDCYLDSAKIRLINFFADELRDTVMQNGILHYKFLVGAPNPSPPYLKTFQIIATTYSGNETSLTLQGVVTGVRAKANTFTTQLPETPTLVLRDPPGDGSYAYVEKGQQSCRTLTTTVEYTTGFGGGVEISSGPTVKLVFGIGAATIEETGVTVKFGLDGQASFTKVTDNSMEVCTSFSERFSTSSDDLVVGGGQGGDVFVGGGLNVEFGFADEVSFNDTICEPQVKVILAVSPKNFGTTFMYSEWGIVNNVIRYLDAIKNDPGTTPGKKDTCMQSIARWNKILDNNNKQKAAAKFKRNISFDAGFEYEYSETSDTTSTHATTNTADTEGTISLLLGGEFNDVGATGNVKFFYSTSNGKSTETGAQKGFTTGYVLADNDPGDAFSIDVAMDSVYKTPVFRTKSGQSSCPWEPGTAHREGTNLQMAAGYGPVAVDVPSKEPAVYKFILGNTSETNEVFTYGFTAGPESNPDGAIIKVNGAALDHPIMYAIPYGTSIPVTLTLERGPVKYNYDSLEIVLYSLCEDDRANNLGIDPALDKILYSAIYISAHFIEPCSEVEINVPQQDWVIFPDPLTTGSDDVLRITTSGYDKSQAQFDSIRVQYRRSDGDGAWINIVPPNDPNIQAVQHGASIVKANLGDVFTQFYWDTQGLSDGPYEIRAIALCSGNADDKPGYSHIIKGRIERQPPSLIGTPEPSDGVLQVGDEISFTFNKDINCSKLNPVTKVLLFDETAGNKPIDINVTCEGNKILLVPNIQNVFIENHILRAELHNIEDQIGNNLVYTQWEFYVDRNELGWLTDSVGMTKFEDETKTVTANIHNRGGYPAPFIITDVPNWVHVVPNQGTLAPNEIRPISFIVDSTLAFGSWTDSVTMRTITGQNPFFMGGDERIPFGVRVVCRPPNWNLNANLFENTMNMVVELSIKGKLSSDVEDMVVAYIGDTLAGRAHIQYVPEVKKYLAYLTIYGNPDHILSPIRLEIWDASACLRYAVQEDYFIFEPDAVFGIPTDPLILHTADFVLRDIPLGYGWNWMSFNLAFPNASLDSALISLKHPQNDLMKGQNKFSVYLNGAGWLGTLDTLGNKTMYIYRADQPDTLKMLGNLLDPATTPIPLASGWNWIGYIPNYSLPVNDALASLSAQTGDLIKSQVSFAQYINPVYGWIGNLKYMQPPNGYQIKLTTPGTLVYPPQPTNRVTGGSTGGSVKSAMAANSKRLIDRGPAGPSFWNVNPTQFENSMTLIGMLKVNNANATTATMELGAFAGTEVRGSAQAIYIAPLQSYLFFLTTYANGSGEQIRYKLFDSSTGIVQPLSEVMYFSADLHQGSIDAPVPFTLTAAATTESAFVESFDVMPNPFHSETMFRFAMPAAREVFLTITNVSGQTVSSIRTTAHEGLNTLTWKGHSDSGERLSPGVYFVRLQTESGIVVRKVVLQ